MDTNLSSSTDELLKLAGGGPLQKLRVRLPSYEDSPPSTPESTILRKVANQKEADASQNPQEDLNATDEYNHVVQGFQHLTVNQPPIIPLQQSIGLSKKSSGTIPQQSIGALSPPTVGTLPQTSIGGALLDSQAPILAPVRPQQPPICRYFASGFCSQGDRCNFAHIEYGFTTNGAAIVHKTRFKNGRVPIPASQYANLKLEDCIGEIAPMCLDQHGCRYLQRQLDTGDQEVIKLIFYEVIDHIVELMSDPFGNYLCQKLIEHCSEEQRIEIVKGVATDIVHISKNMHGTRAVQKLIEHLASPEENKLVRNALKGSVVGLIQDLNGNHVIQKCLHKMEPNDNQFIYDAVAQHCIQVSTHRHGCCVMQRCIDHATLDQKLQLVRQIKLCALDLVQDAFGNYVVQYALDLEIPNLATELIMQLQTKLLYLARQKFSSNVVEKCLKVGNSLCVTRVLRELLDEDTDPEVLNPAPSLRPEVIQQNLIELLQDSYGNYVIQTCLSEGANKAPLEYYRMVHHLQPYVHQLRNAPYIKRICNLLCLAGKNDQIGHPGTHTSTTHTSTTHTGATHTGGSTHVGASGTHVGTGGTHMGPHGGGHVNAHVGTQMTTHSSPLQIPHGAGALVAELNGTGPHGGGGGGGPNVNVVSGMVASPPPPVGTEANSMGKQHQYQRHPVNNGRGARGGTHLFYNNNNTQRFPRQ